MSWMGLLLLLNAALLVYLGWRLFRLRKLADLLEQELALLRHQPYDEAPDLERLLGSGQRPLVTLDILNPMEVAAQQSWFADKFGALAAPAIRKIVYEQTTSMLREQLAEHGVRAQVRLHRAA